MDYVGEHLFISIIGRFAIVLAFVGAAFSAISYYFQTKETGLDKSWNKLGRYGFFAHVIGVSLIIIMLFIMLFNHFYEYDYAWKHSNNIMPIKYIMSCFWEGQEGSFLLWLFWHAVLGLILMKWAKGWEPFVMTIFGIVQIFLASMLLGIYIFGEKFGSNPFILIRELPENLGLPWTSRADYLELPQFEDGRGLNPLLQNYWMTIHPPTLFLGFSLTLVPFAYAIAGIWRKEYKKWIAPALPWTFVAVAILGLGILMGGAWAYEALSFGGFWAWDPVENASLVPWLTLLGGAHVMLISNKKGESLFTAYFLICISFILILYSTFLTRSGVLGDTSVHSFTGNDMLGQLLFYLLFFVWLMIVSILDKLSKLVYTAISVIILLAEVGFDFGGIGTFSFIILSIGTFIWGYYKFFPKQKEEEPFWSREFWMFVGAIVLTLSALQIISTTSIPVFNLIFDTNFAPPTETEERLRHYNEWQLPFAIVVTALIGITQFINYRKTDPKKVFKKIALPIVVTLIATSIFSWVLGYSSTDTPYIILLFTGLFAFFSNLEYWRKVLKGKVNHAGSSVAHIGFALVMVGALVSTSKSDKISESRYDLTQLSENFKSNESILLYQGDTLKMGEYFVSYRKKFKEGINLLFEVDYYKNKPNSYKKDDVVLVSDMVFKAIEDHHTSPTFIEDKQHWELITRPQKDTSDETKTYFNLINQASQWIPFIPGDLDFKLHPFIQLNPRFGNVPEPATKHYPHKDIYSHVQYADLEMPEDKQEEFSEYKEHKLSLGDTIVASNCFVILDTVVEVKDKEKHKLLSNDFAIAAVLRLIDTDGKEYFEEPLVILRDSVLKIPDEAYNEALRIKFQVGGFEIEGKKVKILMSQHKGNRRDFVVMQAIIFPYINILWIGCILMVIGSLMAVIQRIKTQKKKPIFNKTLERTKVLD